LLLTGMSAVQDSAIPGINLLTVAILGVFAPQRQHVASKLIHITFHLDRCRGVVWRPGNCKFYEFCEYDRPVLGMAYRLCDSYYFFTIYMGYLLALLCS